MTKEISKKYRYIIVVVTVFLGLSAVATIAFFMPGGLRSAIIPNYVQSSYPKQLQKDYDQIFNGTRDRLESYSLTIRTVSNPTVNGYVSASCSKYYSGFQATYSCSKADNTLEIPLDEDKLNIWQAKSKAFEQSLLTDNWVKQFIATEPIDKITSGYKSVNYQRIIGNTTCTLSIGHPGSVFYADAPHLRVLQACNKALKLFGGY